MFRPDRIQTPDTKAFCTPDIMSCQPFPEGTFPCDNIILLGSLVVVNDESQSPIPMTVFNEIMTGVSKRNLVRQKIIIAKKGT